MKKREYRDYLNDIVECIDDVKSFIAGMKYKDFFPRQEDHQCSSQKH